VTGPVSVNMEEAFKRTFHAVPDPKLVVSVGDCGTCGGVFAKSYASRGAVTDVIPVDHTGKACPPAPAALLQAILQTIQTTDR
jgi:Ni,Fe-hydrogenase III small subunit